MDETPYQDTYAGQPPPNPYGNNPPPQNPYGGPPPGGPYGQPPIAGMADNVAGGIAYITVIPAILFLVLPPYNGRPFVRFHSFQCIFLTLASIVVSALHIIPFLGTILALVLHFAIFILWLIAIIQAFQGKKYKIPFIGDYAEQAAAS